MDQKFNYKNENTKSTQTILWRDFVLQFLMGKSLTKYDTIIQTQIKRKIHTFAHNKKASAEPKRGWKAYHK